MIRTATLLLAASITLLAAAQNWNVGQPLDMLLYTQTFYGGCNPNADYTFNFPPSTVDGVDHIIRVVSVAPTNGTLDLMPGFSGVTTGASMLVDEAVMRYLTMSPGTTSATLEFRAVGTPTTAGQTHACAPSEFWISNLMICPDGLTPIIGSDCSVQGGATAIVDTEMPAPTIDLPSVRNGQRLTISLPSFETANAIIVDATGRTVITKYLAQGGAIGLNTSPDGAYVLQLVRSNGDVVTKRFVINQQ